MCVHAYAVFIHAHVFTCVHPCLANVASYLASYLPFSLNYNATILVTGYSVLFIQGLSCISKDGKQNCRRSRINKPNTVSSYWLLNGSLSAS